MLQYFLWNGVMQICGIGKYECGNFDVKSHEALVQIARLYFQKKTSYLSKQRVKFPFYAWYQNKNH
jgi:hypothetical protein